MSIQLSLFLKYTRAQTDLKVGQWVIELGVYFGTRHGQIFRIGTVLYAEGL